MNCQTLALSAALLGFHFNFASAIRTVKSGGEGTEDTEERCPEHSVAPDGKGHCLASETHAVVPMKCCDKAQQCNDDLHSLQFAYIRAIQALMPCTSPQDMQALLSSPDPTQVKVDMERVCSPECKASMVATDPMAAFEAEVAAPKKLTTLPKFTDAPEVHGPMSKREALLPLVPSLDLSVFIGQCKHIMSPADTALMEFLRQQDDGLSTVYDKTRKCAETERRKAVKKERRQLAEEQKNTCPFENIAQGWSECLPKAQAMAICPSGCNVLNVPCSTTAWFPKWFGANQTKPPTEVKVMCVSPVVAAWSKSSGAELPMPPMPSQRKDDVTENWLSDFGLR